MPVKRTPQQTYELLKPLIDDIVEHPEKAALLEPAEVLAITEFLESIPASPNVVSAKIIGEDDPIRFIRVVLGVAPTEAALKAGYTLPVTAEQLAVIQSVEANKRTAVVSGHGVGKTAVAAFVALRYLLQKPERRVITTASNWPQVEKVLWSEIRKRHAAARVKLPGRITKTNLEIAPGWYAVGLSTDEYARFSGHHSPTGTLVIIDEATGVRSEVAEAAQSMIVGPDDRLLADGNPTDPASWFKQASESPLWNTIYIDCRKHPNVVHRNPAIIPGAVTYEWVQDKIEECGGEESPLFLAQVAGQWPVEGQESLISQAWILRAQTLEEVNDDRGVALGLDVAGPGGDLLVLSAIKNRKWRILTWKPKNEWMEAAGLLVRAATDLNARIAALDDTGAGGAISSRLRELRSSGEFPSTCRLLPLNFASRAPHTAMFDRMKSQLWWTAREVLRHGFVALPTDDEIKKYGLRRQDSLIRQLAAPLYYVMSNGQIRVFDKHDEYNEKTKLLSRDSPDLAHSFILACFGWRMLREQTEEERVAPPATTEELYAKQFQETFVKPAIERYQRKYERGGVDEDDGLSSIF